MKKILFLLLVLFGGILFFMHKYSTEKNINNYMLVDIETINNPRLYCVGYPEIKLTDKKTNLEVKKYNNLVDGLFLLKNGDYKLEILYHNKIITRDIEKKSDTGLKYKVFLEQSAEMKYFDDFTRLFGLGILVSNIMLFLKLMYKKDKKELFVIFCHLIIMQFLSFTNIFTGYQLNILQIIVEISLFYSLTCYFSSYLRKKHKKTANYVQAVSVIFIVFISLMLLLVINENILVYFIEYHSFIFNIFVIIFYIIIIILNLANFFIAYIVLINRFINIKNKELKKLKGYQILFMTLIFIITILVSAMEASFRIYPKYDILFLLGGTVLFWILFFEVNIEVALEINKKYRNLYLYMLKALIVFIFIYIYLIYSKSYRIMIPVLLIYILGETSYYFCKLINHNKSIVSYEKFLNKLKGVDNIEEFQNIIENEILKKNSLESVKFKIFLGYNEEKEYIRISDNNKIVKNENLCEKYENYDFGLRIKVKNDICIALLLIKTKNEKYLNELIASLSIFMDDLVYIINYIRTLSLKNNLEKRSEKEQLNKILEEHLTFIKEFSLLIKKKTKEEDIKKYSEMILQNVKDLGDKFE